MGQSAADEQHTVGVVAAREDRGGAAIKLLAGPGGDSTRTVSRPSASSSTVVRVARRARGTPPARVVAAGVVMGARLAFDSVKASDRCSRLPLLKALILHDDHVATRRAAHPHQVRKSPIGAERRHG